MEFIVFVTKEDGSFGVKSQEPSGKTFLKYRRYWCDGSSESIAVGQVLTLDQTTLDEYFSEMK